MFLKLINRVLEPGQSLSQRAIRGALWVFTTKIVTRGLGFIRIVILARLLSPADFGLLGIVMLAMVTLETFSQTGFEMALIQRKNQIERYLDTVWSVSVVRGVVLSLLMFLVAPLVAGFFHNPTAIVVIRVLAVTFLIKGFINIGVIYLQRELQFGKHLVLTLSGTVADIMVAIPLALIFRNVWALVFGLVAADTSRLIFSYAVHPYRPSFAFSIEMLRKLSSFGKWVVGSTVVTFFTARGDDAFVGRVLGTAALGLYQLAFELSNMVATEISYVVAKVTFPVYSRLQGSVSDLRDGYLRTFQLIMFISLPLAIGIMLLSPEFTRIFLGAKWIPIVPAVQIMALSGLARSITSTGSPLFIGAGRPRAHFAMQLMALSVIAITIYPLTVRWNIAGTAWAVTLSSLSMIPVWAKHVKKIAACNYGTYFRILSPLIVASGVMCLGILSYMGVVGSLGIPEFIFCVIVGILCYIGAIYSLEKVLGYGPLKEMKLALSLLRSQ